MILRTRQVLSKKYVIYTAVSSPVSAGAEQNNPLFQCRTHMIIRTIFTNYKQLRLKTFPL